MLHDHEHGSVLVRLLDDDRLDEVLSQVSLAEIADAWRCYHERAKVDEHLDDEDPDWWAVQFWGYEAQWVCERLERAAGVPLARPDT